METGTAELRVFFEDPFWVGVYQRGEAGKISACRVVFGAEPRDQEVYGYFLEHWRELEFSPPVAADGREDRRRNPKRIQREIRQTLQQTGIGTKAQQALKLQQEQGKAARRERRRQRREEDRERQFALRQQKRKDRHRGK